MDEDPEGNVAHIAEHGVTKKEVESVFADPDRLAAESDSSGRPIVKGYTYTRRYVIVVYEEVDDNPLTVYPVTAFEPTEQL